MEHLCANCKHSTPRMEGIGAMFCLHHKNMTISKVDGAREMQRTCAAAREHHHSCGVMGTWYEERK
jgi:hypothetical protein